MYNVIQTTSLEKIPNRTVYSINVKSLRFSTPYTQFTSNNWNYRCKKKLDDTTSSFRNKFEETNLYFEKICKSVKHK